MARMRYCIPDDTAKLHKVTIPYSAEDKRWVLNSTWMSQFGLKLPACPEYAEQEMCDWIRSNCTGTVHLVNCFRGARRDIVFEFFFKNLSEATMFKLNYCG